MVSRTNGHLFHHTTPFTKAAGSDRHDGNDWNDLVSEFDKLVEITSADTPFTPNEDDTFIIADASGGAITITPAAANTLIGKEYIIVKIDSSTNAVTFDPAGSEQIDFAATKAVTTQGGLMRVRATSTEWFSTSVAPAGGEANTGGNVGSGTGLIFRDKTGVSLNFKSLIAGSGISIANNANDITLSASGGGGSDMKTNVFEGGIQVGTVARQLDFDASDFNVTEDSANDQFDIGLNYGTGAGQPAEGNHGHSGTLDANARLAVNKNSGATIGTRRRINLIEGPNMTLTVADDAANEEVDITFEAQSGSAVTGYNVPSSSSVSAINSAIGTTARRKVGLQSATTYVMSTNDEEILFPRADGQMLDGQRARIQVGTSTTWASTDAHISSEGVGVPYDYVTIQDLEFDFNGNGNHARGISNFNASNGTTGNTTQFKTWRIDNVNFIGHAAVGKEPIYIKQWENGSVISRVRIIGLTADSSNKTAGIRVSGTNTSKVEGNIVHRDCYVSGGNNIRAYMCDGNIERVLWQGCRAFYSGSTKANGATGFYLNPASNDRYSNRAWVLSGCSAEDMQTGIDIEIQTPGKGVDAIVAFDIADTLIDAKECAAAANTTRCIWIHGTGDAAGHIHHSDCRARFETNNEECIGIDIDSAITTQGGGLDRTGITIDHVSFVRKLQSGQTGTKWIPIKGLESQDFVFVHDCEGYNPLGAITNPWKGTELNNPDAWEAGTTPSISGGSASPANGTTYTVRHTRKTVTISGGTVSAIVINGTTTGLTAGVFVLDPGETIRVNHSVAPTTATVYCH